MKTNNMAIRKLTPTIGAEISGVDLSMPLSNEEFERVHEALLDNLVIFFRDQNLTPEQHIAVGRRFGKLEKHPHLSTEVENHPEIYVLQFDETAKDGKVNQRRGWHADLTCDEIPTMGAVLYIQELPRGGGGDTLWASMYAAYEALADPMKRFLLGLTAVHDGRVYLEAGNNRRDLEVPTAEHPIIRTHPITRRRGLFVNQTFTQRIPQLNLEESEAILQMLFRHIERPEFQCRFKWEMGSLAIWDNRCTQHNPVRDYFPNKRRVHRVTIAGSKPFLDLSGAP